MPINLEEFVRRGQAAQRAVDEELRRHKVKTRNEEIIHAAIEALEKTKQPMLDFCQGLKDLRDTAHERLELAVSELEPNDRETWANS